MKTIKIIIIEKDIINSRGAIIISKGKKIRLDLHTIDRLKAHGIYYKVLDSSNGEWYVYLNLLCDGYEWFYSHSINVAYISASIGLKLGYTKEQISNLILGSLIHDIGVVLIPKNIALKKKKFFTPAERILFEKHSLLGYDMIKNLSIPEQ